VRIVRRADWPLLRLLALVAVLECGPARAWNSAHAEPDSAGDVSIPPLCDAALRGDVGAVRALLRKGAPVDVRFDGETPLMKALAPYIGMPPSTTGPMSARRQRAWLYRIESKMEIAKVLIEAGADVRLTSPDGATALHLAALADGPEKLVAPVVRDLIRRGAVVDARTSEGRTPLQFAVWRKRLAIAKILVASGASLDGRDNLGKTAADELVAHGNEHALDELRAVASKRR